MRLIRLAFVAPAAVLFVGACQDSTSPTGPEAPSPALLQQAPEATSLEDLDRAMPGFGGFYYDRSGRPVVYLTQRGNRAAAERALEGVLRTGGHALADLQVRPARYGFGQLQSWYARASAGVLDLPGAVFVDNDETVNRVRIGVADLVTHGQARGVLAQLNVPDDAIILEQADPIVQVATLRDQIRPVQAGLQIHFGGFVCSIGFNATLNGQASMVTASHCTDRQGGEEGTVYYQPLSPAQIATEVDDPDYTRNQLPGCPRGRKCRFSDAARAAYGSASNMALGVIARTTGANNGSLTLSGTFSIGSDDCNTLGGCLAAGTVVNKVGRTTGWTQGAITNTCVNTGVSGTNIVQLCQTFVSAGVGGGDSGSDVFQGTSNVTLAGVLWGGNGAGTQFVYSPLGNVKAELGNLLTH
ncbi:MAG: hypothetical protein ACRENB_14280 [Gemmatimonadales bacterium]